MIQDIFPRRLCNQYDPAQAPDENSFVLRFHRAELLVCTGAQTRLPCVCDFDSLPALTYLFSVDEERYFLLQEDVPCRSESTFMTITALRESGFGPQHRLFAVMTAKHLSDWYADNRFCGRCASPMIHSDKERCMVCSRCGYHVYPRIMPAVIVGVINGDSLLLTHYRTGYRHNALIAGFTEIGETLEETVAREVMEESGLRVKNIRYYKSQPWGVANDILMGYYCEVDGDDSIRMDESELSYAKWVPRAEIVLQPDSASLTNEMMMMFRDGKIKKPEDGQTLSL